MCPAGPRCSGDLGRSRAREESLLRGKEEAVGFWVRREVGGGRRTVAGEGGRRAPITIGDPVAAQTEGFEGVGRSRSKVREKVSGAVWGPATPSEV